MQPMIGVCMICMAMPGNGSKIVPEIIITVHQMMARFGMAVVVAAGYCVAVVGTVLPTKAEFLTETGCHQINQAQAAALDSPDRNYRAPFYEY